MKSINPGSRPIPLDERAAIRPEHAGNGSGIVREPSRLPALLEPSTAPPADLSEIDREAAAPGVGGHYVYAHRDISGNIFYIGKGSGEYAWSWERPASWLMYVHLRSQSRFFVQILSYHQSNEEARNRALQLVQRYGPALINSDERVRAVAFTLRADFHAKHEALQSRYNEVKSLEEGHLKEAVEGYTEALHEAINFDQVMKNNALPTELLLRRERTTLTKVLLLILDRLTLCLRKLGDQEGMANAITDFEKRYPELSETHRQMAVIRRRVGRS